MKIKASTYILCLLLFVSLGVKAHSPDHSSTLLVEQEDNVWVLQIRSALTAFEYEIHQNFGATSYATAEEFQALVVKHVRDRMTILFNDENDVEFKNGQVMLGHETSVTFELANTPTNIQALSVKNGSFSDLPHSQSALMVYKKGFAKNQFKLDKGNSHTVTLKVNNSTFELDTQSTQKSSLPIFIIGSVLCACCLIFMLIKKRKSTQLKQQLQIT